MGNAFSDYSNRIPGSIRPNGIRNRTPDDEDDGNGMYAERVQSQTQTQSQQPLRSWADVANAAYGSGSASGPVVMSGYNRFRYVPTAGQGSANLRQVPPVQVSTPAPTIQSAVKVQNLLNVHTDSVKLIEIDGFPGRFFIQFTYDATCAGNIYVFFVATDSGSGVDTPQQRFREKYSHHSRELHSDKSLFGRITMGKSQVFNSQNAPNSSCFFDVNFYETEDLVHYNGKSFPIVIVLEAANPDEKTRGIETNEKSSSIIGTAKSQSTFITLVCEGEDPLSLKYAAKVYKQTITYNNRVYMYKKLYGETSSESQSKSRTTTTSRGNGDEDDDDDDDASLCVICLSEPRTAIILPCLHMCLCEECANTLRQSNASCPLCRSAIKQFWINDGSANKINQDTGTEAKDSKLK